MAKGYNEKGEEIMDDSRPEMPLGFKRPETLAEQVRRLVKSEALALEASKQGRETFEESEDFDVGDDYDPTSPYEENFDPAEYKAIDRAVKKAKKRKGEGNKQTKVVDEPPRAASEAAGSTLPVATGGDGGGQAPLKK